MSGPILITSTEQSVDNATSDLRVGAGAMPGHDGSLIVICLIHVILHDRRRPDRH